VYAMVSIHTRVKRVTSGDFPGGGPIGVSIHTRVKRVTQSYRRAGVNNKFQSTPA